MADFIKLKLEANSSFTNIKDANNTALHVAAQNGSSKATKINAENEVIYII